MPLFFLISDFVIRNGNRESISEYIKKQTVRLFLPAFVFVTLFLPVYFMTADEINLWDVVKRICSWEGLVPYNDPCWFFFVLYEAKVLERILNIAPRRMRIKLMAYFLSFLLRYIIYQMNIFLPFGLDRCAVAFGFMMAGMCIKEAYLQLQPLKKSRLTTFYGAIFLA